MKVLKRVFLIAICFTSIQASAFEFSVGLSTGYTKMRIYEGKVFGGVNLNFEFDNNWGVHYSLLFGKRYIHMPLSPMLGIVAAGYSLNSSSSDSEDVNQRLKDALIVVVLVSMIPESVSYRIPLNSQLELAPYVSPLQLDIYYGESFHPIFAVGSKIHFNIEALSARISPYFEYKFEYGNINNWAIGTGLEFSIALY